MTVDNNTTNENAMAGIFVGGEQKGIKIRNNPSVDGNNLNCEDHEGGIFLSGVMSKINISNNDVDGNNANGIGFTGHSKSMKILDNDVTNNVGNGMEGDHTFIAGILVHGRSLNLQIVGNTASSNTNDNANPVFTGHGIDVRGSVRKVGKAKQAVLIKDNTTENNEGHGVGIFVEASKPISNTDPTRDTSEQDDQTANQPSNVKLIENRSNNNGTDGLFMITDVLVKDNTANDNTDFGMEFNEDPTAPPRSADAADGPHKLKDGGGNSAVNNGTNCSPEIDC
jgi:hypothetical protein